jgi:hypothetical protein
MSLKSYPALLDFSWWQKSGRSEDWLQRIKEVKIGRLQKYGKRWRVIKIHLDHQKLH